MEKNLYQSTAEFLDYGPDYYAAVTFNDAPERISIGWMNNWLYANERVLETWNGSMSAARKLEQVDGKLKQSFIGQTYTYQVTANQFEFVYKNGALKFKRDGENLIIDRSELWDSKINTFTLPATGDLEITALFDAGSIELSINGRMVTALLEVGSETPELRSK